MTDTNSTPDLEAEKAERRFSVNLSTPNTNPRLTFSQSLYQLARNSPWAAVSSIAALFIVLVLCTSLPLLFPLKHNNSD